MGAGRKSCLPVPLGAAQPRSYWLLISQLGRPGGTERFVNGLLILTGDVYPVGPSSPHTGFHRSSKRAHTRLSGRVRGPLLIPHTHTSNDSVFFPQRIIGFIHLCHPRPPQGRSLTRRPRPLLVQSDAHESSRATQRPAPGTWDARITSWHCAADVVNGHCSQGVMTEQYPLTPRKDWVLPFTCKHKQSDLVNLRRVERSLRL